MEVDRSKANLGPGAGAELDVEVIEKPKQPKRRFVGRRTAEKAEKQPSSNGTIEDSCAIQGLWWPRILAVKCTDSVS